VENVGSNGFNHQFGLTVLLGNAALDSLKALCSECCFRLIKADHCIWKKKKENTHRDSEMLKNLTIDFLTVIFFPTH